MRPTIIRRKTKRECQLAILELESRGFEVIKKIEEIKFSNKDWIFDNYYKPIFNGTNSGSFYMAIMKKAFK